VNPLQGRQKTAAPRGRIAILAAVAPHHLKTIARPLSRISEQKGRAAIPTWRGHVSVASAVATGAVVNTDLLPRHARYSLLGQTIVGALMYSLLASRKITGTSRLHCPTLSFAYG
jgi:hypothetical protein